MCKPITVTLLSDHLTINLDDLPKDPELIEKFYQAIPKSMRQIEMQHKKKDLLMLFGNPIDVHEFMWNVTRDFDLLIV